MRTNGGSERSVAGRDNFLVSISLHMVKPELDSYPYLLYNRKLCQAELATCDHEALCRFAFMI